MSAVSRTPGSWARNGRRVESAKEHGWANDGWVIATCEGPDAEANAALIAAAPDIEEAAKYALQVLNRGAGKQARLRAIERLQAALAMAQEGQG